MIVARSRHGTPLAALGLIVGGWITVRVMLASGGLLPPGLAEAIGPIAGAEAEGLEAPGRHSEPRRPGREFALAQSPSPWSDARVAVRSTGDRGSDTVPATVLLAPGPAAASPQTSSATSLGAAPFPPASRPPVLEPAAGEQRWSADGWLLLRPGDKSGARLLATYGASQAGAVLRYRLAPASGHRPAAYLRAAAALDGSRQREAAAGLSVRPLPGLPIVAAAELRVTSDRFGSRTRPAVLAYTELAPFELAPGLRSEIYLQGGYVGGTGATRFIDGQLRADGMLAGIGRGELRLGGGLWGGAQEGASRLDVGPSVQIVTPLSPAVFARLSADWRFRIAGNAAPASGPALTLSAGF